MPLGAASTLTQVQNSYDDNASYEEEGDAVKARAFITACRILLRRLPQQIEDSSGQRRQSLQRDLQRIQAELDAARQWLATNGGAVTPSGAGSGAGALYASIEDFRE